MENFTPYVEPPSTTPILVSAWAGSLGLVLAMFGATLWLWEQVSAQARIPIHWDALGRPNGYAGRAGALVMAPCIALGASLLLGLMAYADPRVTRSRPTLKAYRGVWLGLVALLALLHACMLGLALGHNVPVVRVLMAGLGALLAYSGWVMRTVEPNGVIGIRTRATLADPQVWAKVHHTGGRLFLALGSLLALAALANLPAPALLAILIGGLALSTVGMLVLSARAKKGEKG